MWDALWVFKWTYLGLLLGLGYINLDGANLQIKTYSVPKIMHQNLAIILWQFNYSKNRFIVLSQITKFKKLISVHNEWIASSIFVLTINKFIKLRKYVLLANSWFTSHPISIRMSISHIIAKSSNQVRIDGLEAWIMIPVTPNCM